MSKKKVSRFRTDVTQFTHTVWVVSTGRWPTKQDHYASTSFEEAQERARKVPRASVVAQHVIFMNGSWWRVLATPVSVSVPLPKIPFAHPAAPKFEPLPLTTTHTYTWRQRLRILFTGRITVTSLVYQQSKEKNHERS